MQDQSGGGQPLVIVTRPEADGRAFAEALAAADFAPVLSPMTEIRFHAAAPALSGIGAVAFTSANGVRALAHAAGPVALPVFAVGEATAREAEARGFHVAGVGAGNVESLARLIAQAAEAGAFEGAALHAAGSERAGDLAGALARAGVPARCESLYEARPVGALTPAAAQALRQGKEVWAALFSPRSASLFIEAVDRAGLREDLKRAGALCLSDAVAKAARRTRWAQIAVAPDRSAEAMIAALCQTRRRRHP